MRTTNTIKSVVLVLIALILIAAAGVGIYLWQHSNVNNLKKDNQQLQSQITSLQNTNQQLDQNLQNSQSQKAPSDSQPATNTYQSAKGTEVIVYKPTSGAKVSSPLAIIGLVPGNWSFEASFPIKLADQSGSAIASGTGHVLGSWTTSQLVPFSAQLTYTSAASGTGSLVLEKDNPSGLAANQDSVAIPVRF